MGKANSINYKYSGYFIMGKNHYSFKIYLSLLIFLFFYEGVVYGGGWKLLDTNLKTVLPSIFFLDDQRGWGVSVRGATIYYTEDGGRNWVEKFKVERGSNKSYSPELNSIYFADKNNGWVAGNNHIILHTFDGGNTWSYQESGLEPINVLGVLKTRDLFSIHFVDSNHGWAVGFLGTIISTDNGGLTWQKQKSGTNDILWKVFFVDQEHGWAVGGNGTILYTENSGRGHLGGIIKGWKKQESNTDVHLFDVYFIDQNTGWSVGADVILYTKNGGRSWETKRIEGAKHLRGVRFVDKDNGWVVGTNKIHQTTDGGRTWKTFESGSQQWLHNIFFLNKNYGWISGGNGTILRYVGEDGTGK